MASLGLPTFDFSILGHRRTIEGPKAPNEAREAQSAGALRGWSLGSGAIALPQHGKFVTFQLQNRAF